MSSLKEWISPPKARFANKKRKVVRNTEKYPQKLKRFPTSIDEQDKLADELIEWALKDGSIILEEFPLSKMISPYLFFSFAKNETNDYFTQAFDFARAYCSLRREKGDHNINMAIVLRLLPLYNRQYGEYLEQKEARALESGKSGNSTIVVQMENASKYSEPIVMKEYIDTRVMPEKRNLFEE